MSYKIKKIFFFLSAILSSIMLFYLAILDLYHWNIVQCLVDDTFGIGSYFSDDSMIFPVFFSAALLSLNAVIYLILYRRELCFWPKYMLLFAGLINTFTYGPISDRTFDYQQNSHSPNFWQALLFIYAAIALAAIIWLIVAMVKYPNPASKSA